MVLKYFWGPSFFLGQGGWGRENILKNGGEKMGQTLGGWGLLSWKFKHASNLAPTVKKRKPQLKTAIKWKPQPQCFGNRKPHLKVGKNRTPHLKKGKTRHMPPVPVYVGGCGCVCLRARMCYLWFLFRRVCKVIVKFLRLPLSIIKLMYQPSSLC